MTDGQRLRQFVENQSKSIKRIYTDLGLSKQGFYNYFDSIEMEPETKNRIEQYFGTRIFEVNIDQSGKNVLQGHFKAQGEGHTDDTRISGLIESNRMMAAAMLADAENRERLTRSNEELTAMVKRSVGDQSKTLAAFESRLQAFLAALSLVASGKRYKSEVEASAALSKLVYDGPSHK